ncbi:lysozyme inhibitor LprI family protein [Paraburkholderia antibiotica]|uniref:lysozyme inhibitor LprI family protein n=1 Tax=Paraburkholderia antibiotica TaxID=2728839 RepID=UPI00197D6B2C|nr:hypothetical protein [Paraburkholderia antibiotica]
MAQIEGLSKREQAALDFSNTVEKRVSHALRAYLLSHGTYALADHLDDAMSLEEHSAVAGKLRPLLRVTGDATTLASDLHSISLSEKEKAMKAVYEIERICSENSGQVTGIPETVQSMLDLIRHFRASCGSGLPIFLMLAGGALVFASGLIGSALVFAGAFLAYVRFRSFRKDQKRIRSSFASSNARFDALVVSEVSRRPMLPANQESIGHSVWAAGVLAVACLSYVALHTAIDDKSIPPDARIDGTSASHRDTNRDLSSRVSQPNNVSAPSNSELASVDVATTSATEDTSTAEVSESSSGPLAQKVFYPTSFDCSKARSTAEHLICTDPELASDDRELATIFLQAKAAVTDQAAFKERTRREWNYRERSCHDRECLVRWYADQKTALSQMATTGRLDD